MIGSLTTTRLTSASSVESSSPKSERKERKASFFDIWTQHPWERVQEKIYAVKEEEVAKALSSRAPLSMNQFAALISPAAAPFLDAMAKKSSELTRQRFGNTIQLYIPLYLSNECQNICTYCGFSYTNKIQRLTLTDKQILGEVEVLKDLGYEHVLLVTGESQKKAGVGYIANAIKLIRQHFAQISMEVQPLSDEDYRQLTGLGLHSVLVYQETYNSESYALYHPKGKKANFRNRLETPERLGRAGLHKIGLGALLGLDDWRVDSFFVALHLSFLRRRYWQTKYSISFPRLRPAEGAGAPKAPVSERELAQLICAFRLFDENLDLSLSTREREIFRDNAMHFGINTMSAGSRTEPGGYAKKDGALKQFDVADERSPAQFAAMLRNKGYEPVWKDWDEVFDSA